MVTSQDYYLEKRESKIMRFTDVIVLTQGMSFGELSILRNNKRSATCQ